MRCLVTGGAGFIGSHLAEELTAQGHEVTALDDLSTGSLDNLKHCSVNFVKGSVLDGATVAGLVKNAEQVYHLAAVVGVKEAFEDPLRALEVNVDGTRTVLEAVFAYDKRLLAVSSSEVYGYGKASKLKELDPGVMGSAARSLRWAYGVSKLMDEFMVLAHHQKYRTRVTVVRPFNVVGPRQTGAYGMVLPRFVDQALSGKPLTVYGNGKQTRCFAYVTEVARAFRELLEEERTVGRVYNVAGNMETGMLELAQKVKKLARSDSPVHFVPYEEAYGPGFDDAMHRYADTTCLKNCLGWTPTMSVEEMIRRTIEWRRLFLQQ